MKYFIKTYGCQMNKSNSERIAMTLKKKGYKSAESMESADLIVINACSVRQTAVDRVFGLEPKFKKLQALNPKLQTILTGCVLKSDKIKLKKYFDEVLDIKEFLGKNYLSLKPLYSSSSSAFVPIMTGCNNFCSYCVVPFTRGQEISRPAQEIISEIKTLIGQGYKEITLLGQNVNSYKSKEKNNKLRTIKFPKLLKMVNLIPGDFQIKFLTSHPKDFSDKLIKTIAGCEKVVKEIHLPVQSGDDEILRKMNRGYSVKQYKNLIKKIRQKIPQVKFSTDVIVGFPGETKKQFENTVKLFKEIKYDMAYINKYSSRVGTIATKWKDNISWKEKKRRWIILNKIVNEKPKLIIIVGPTASGKSDLAIELAKEFSGEVISADSRQVYKEMDKGTAKITKKEMQNIPHHLLSIASPKRRFTVAQYQRKAINAISKIYKKNKLPILCGGTGFYLQSVTDGLIIPAIKPDLKLRKKLEKETTKNLFRELKKLDPRRGKNIDSKNRRRLIRALEIIIKTGKPVPPLQFFAQGRPTSGWDTLMIGIKNSPKRLRELIDKRVDRMIKNGLEKEVKTLVRKYGWTGVLKNTIGYSSFAKASDGKQEIVNDIKLRTLQYVKRQMTWFKKNKKIHWIVDDKQAKRIVKNFLEG